MSDSVLENFLSDTIATFRDYKALAEKAFAQLRDEELFVAIDPEANSVAVIVKHMSGNMLSRWTDFLTSDGEKTWRDRDAEFEPTPGATREEVINQWERGWACVFEAVEPLRPEDLSRRVAIRGQAHTVLEAISRQLTHYAYHVGQIVFLAKHLRSSEWKSLSVPKGKSKAFTKNLEEQSKGGGQSRGEAHSRLAPDASLYSEKKKS